MTNLCVLHFDEEGETITLDTGEKLPVVGAFNRDCELVRADASDCVMVLAGPTESGQWVRMVIDPPMTFH